MSETDLAKACLKNAWGAAARNFEDTPWQKHQPTYPAHGSSEEQKGFLMFWRPLIPLIHPARKVAQEISSPHRTLAKEVIAVERTLVQLMPAAPEVLRSLAFKLHYEVRESAHNTDRREFVPLDPQITYAGLPPDG